MSTTLKIKQEMSSTPIDLDGLRRLIALKISDSETRDKDKNSEDGERVERQQGKVCCILTANVLKVHQQR
jgi:hypothetical protein